jgi:hypothetical protein
MEETRVNLNTNTKKLTLTKTERGYLDKSKAILADLGRLAAGKLAEEAGEAAETIGAVQAMLNGAPEEVATGKAPY